MSEEYPYEIENFKYNGFTGRTFEGVAPYTAKFMEWTNDPGIGRFKCSDGKERLIPSFAITNMSDVLPKQTYLGGKQYFGLPTHS